MTNSNISRRSFLKKAGKTSGFVVLAGGVVQLTSLMLGLQRKVLLINMLLKQFFL